MASIRRRRVFAHVNRRRYLSAAAALLGLSGCLQGDDPAGSDSEDDGGDERAPGGEGSPGDDATPDATFEVADAAPPLSPDREFHEDHGVVLALRSTEAADAALESTESVEDFLESTDFGTATLFYVATRAPNSCYGLRVESVEAAGEETVAGTATARDVSESGEGCAAAVITPARLLRASVDGDPPAAATFELTDGWGRTESVQSVAPAEWSPEDPGDGGPEPGDPVEVAGIVESERAADATVSLTVSRDGEQVHAESVTVGADAPERFRFDATVGASYEVVATVDGETARRDVEVGAEGGLVTVTVSGAGVAVAYDPDG